tara:strand:+ start:132322 stop:133656 length:1335 start_codon:yes stop_codon:yes gene_type:complete
MLRKILLLNFNKEQKQKFESHILSLSESVKLEAVESTNELKKSNFNAQCIFYAVGCEKGKLEKDVEEIKRTLRGVPVSFVFEERDFSSLLKVFEFSPAMVLDKDYTSEDLQKALIRCDLKKLRLEDSNMPITNLMELLSSPIKVKSDIDLFRKLTAYFTGFEEKVSLSVLCYDKKNFDLVAGEQVKDREVFNVIKNYVLPKNFIGELMEVPVEGSEKSFMIFPLYKQGDQETWCVCKMKSSNKDFVLNNLFFRHLENALIYRKNSERMIGFQDLANKDEVTGLFNQRKLAADLERAIEEHKANDQTFCIMFIDVDHFKKVNDNFGHVVGSQMLSEIAEELREVLRSSDKIYRYGGDEFVVIMPEASIKTVHRVALRVNESVKKKNFNIGQAVDYKLGLSIGIAEYPSDAQTAKEIIEFADKMMYVSKKTGRGRVYHVNEVDQAE